MYTHIQILLFAQKYGISLKYKESSCTRMESSL